MVSEEQRMTFAGLFVMKLLDLTPAEGGREFPVVLPPELVSFEPVLEHLSVAELLEIDRRKGTYKLTRAGIDLLGTHIDEAEAYIEEFDELEVDEVVATLRKRRLDPLRVRFLWGWYQGEFDDPVVFQQRRGVATVEHDMGAYMLSQAFYSELARDLSE